MVANRGTSPSRGGSIRSGIFFGDWQLTVGHGTRGQLIFEMDRMLDGPDVGVDTFETAARDIFSLNITVGGHGDVQRWTDPQKIVLSTPQAVAALLGEAAAKSRPLSIELKADRDMFTLDGKPGSELMTILKQCGFNQETAAFLRKPTPQNQAAKDALSSARRNR